MSTPEARMRLGESAQTLRGTQDPMDSTMADMLDGYSQLRASNSEKIAPTWKLTVGGKSSKELQRELSRGGFKVSPYVQDLLNSPDFITLEKPEEIELVRRSVKDLGLTGTPTTDEVYTRAQELGLELCPAEVGPHLRLTYTDQPMGEWFYIGMKQVSDRYGDPRVFSLALDGGGVWLRGSWAYPGSHWYPAYEFVFSLRKFNKT